MPSRIEDYEIIGDLQTAALEVPLVAVGRADHREDQSAAGVPLLTPL